MSGIEKKIRVLVVDDSSFMCRVLKEIINADPRLEVVGQGRDGRDGVALAESLSPDVITMDINMPHVDGLQATEQIMSQHPRPIVIVSSESREGTASTLRALELGAVDFVPKPSTGIDLDMKTVGEELTRNSGWRQRCVWFEPRRVRRLPLSLRRHSLRRLRLKIRRRRRRTMTDFRSS